MPRVLGIDTSLNSTGLARVDIVGRQGELHTTIMCATVKGPAKRDGGPKDYSRRIDHTVRILEATLREGVDLVAMEDLAFGQRGPGAFALPWLWGRVVDLCRTLDVPLIVVNTSHVKMYATGKGNAHKDVVLAAAVSRWPDAGIEGNDTADALVCAAVGCRSLGLPVDRMPKAHYERVMAKVGYLTREAASA